MDLYVLDANNGVRMSWRSNDGGNVRSVATGIVDVWDDFSKHENTLGCLVLGGLPADTNKRRVSALLLQR